MTHVNEGGLRPADFAARFAEDPPEPVIAELPRRVARPAPPPDVPGAGTRACFDAQDHHARLWNEGEGAEVRADARASDGLAVWMPGSHHEWAFQVPLARLPQRVRSGRWRVYAVVRVDPAAGADTSGAAFTAGIYDTGTSTVRASISVRVADAGAAYRSHLLGVLDTNDRQYVWVAPSGAGQAEAVWVDRVYFAPAD
jgi:hypothetical protein